MTTESHQACNDPRTVLTTPRLILREMTSADLDDMAALLGDPEVMRAYPAPKTRGDEARAWIGWNQRLPANQPSAQAAAAGAET